MKDYPFASEKKKKRNDMKTKELNASFKNWLGIWYTQTDHLNCSHFPLPKSPNSPNSKNSM